MGAEVLCMCVRGEMGWGGKIPGYRTKGMITRAGLARFFKEISTQL